MRKNEKTANEDANDNENCEVMKNIPDNSTLSGKQSMTAHEVRQGHTGDHVRYILFASVAGAGLVMAGLLIGF